jgi:hypothetical protein
MLKRRRVLRGVGGALAFAVPELVSRPASLSERPHLTIGLSAGEYETAVFDQLPGKKPLIKLSYRPPNYETPVSYFSSPSDRERCILCALPSRRHP